MAIYCRGGQWQSHEGRIHLLGAIDPRFSGPFQLSETNASAPKSQTAIARLHEPLPVPEAPVLGLVIR